MSYQPPPFNYTQPPYGRIPLPQQCAQPLTLDPLLQCTRKGVPITWSVSEHPSTAIANMLLPYGEVWQNRPATYPPTTALTIWSGPTQDRPIVALKDPYVTVADVLLAVYHAIRSAAQEHFQPTYQPLLIPSPHAYPQPVSYPPPNEQQVHQWVLNYLNGHRSWMGLSLKANEPDAWDLHIRR